MAVDYLHQHMDVQGHAVEQTAEAVKRFGPVVAGGPVRYIVVDDLVSSGRLDVAAGE